MVKNSWQKIDNKETRKEIEQKVRKIFSSFIGKQESNK